MDRNQNDQINIPLLDLRENHAEQNNNQNRNQQQRQSNIDQGNQSNFIELQNLRFNNISGVSEQINQNNEVLSLELIPPAQQNFTMSNVFLYIFKANIFLSLLMTANDFLIGSVSLFYYYNSCQGSEVSDWNYKWGNVNIMIGIYHVLVSLQYFSESQKLEICQMLGEYRSVEDNLQKDRQFENELTLLQKTEIRQALYIQLYKYYYLRNPLLYWTSCFKIIIPFYLVIQGLIIFYQGDYFSMIYSAVASNENITSCEFEQIEWVCMNLVFGVLTYLGAFAFLAAIIIIIPIVLFIILPYRFYKKHQQQAIIKQFFENLQNVNYSPDIVQGENQCTICQMDYIIDEQICILPCSNLHHFHKDCIQSWMSINMTCPICRHNFINNIENEN